MKRMRIVCLMCVCLLAVLLAGCASSGKQTISKERANLEALLKDKYGANAIVHQPEMDQYYLLLARNAYNIDHSLVAIQMNVTPGDEVFYSGELFSCVPDQETYAPGEEIRIAVTSHNQNLTTGGAPFRLDMLADGKWYSVNRASTWGMPQYQWTEGKEISYEVSKNLAHESSVEIDSETGLLVNTTDREIAPLQLPEGTYRFSTWVTDTVEGEENQLMCQFQVKAK